MEVALASLTVPLPGSKLRVAFPRRGIARTYLASNYTPRLAYASAKLGLIFMAWL